MTTSKHIPYAKWDLELVQHRLNIHLSAAKIRFEDGRCSECGEQVTSPDPDSARPIFCPDHPASFLDDCHHGPTPQEMLALRPDPADRTSDDR